MKNWLSCDKDEMTRDEIIDSLRDDKELSGNDNDEGEEAEDLALDLALTWME